MDKQRLIKKMDLVQIVSVTFAVQTPFIWIIDHYLASIIVDISSFGFRHSYLIYNRYFIIFNVG